MGVNKPLDPSSIKCLYLNARSLAKRGAIDTLNAHTLVSCIDIVFVTESWLGSNVSDKELSCNDRFAVFRRGRCCRGGGVCILVNRSLNRLDVQIEQIELETVALDEACVQGSIRIVCIYATTSGTAFERKEHIKLLCKAFDPLCDVTVPVIIVGDFNLPGINWSDVALLESSSIEAIFTDSCVVNGLYQMVGDVTRPSRASAKHNDQTNNPAREFETPFSWQSDHTVDYCARGTASSGSIIDLVLTTDPPYY